MSVVGESVTIECVSVGMSVIDESVSIYCVSARISVLGDSVFNFLLFCCYICYL